MCLLFRESGLGRISPSLQVFFVQGFGVDALRFGIASSG